MADEIATMLFSQIKRSAASESGLDISQAVVTVPANSRGKARQRTKLCAGMGGINVLALINEPTAAAMAATRRNREDQSVIVVDWGGGTLDVTVLESIDGIFFPLAGEGLTYVATQVALSNLETQLLGNDLWLDMDFINQENISPHISGMYFVSSFKPNYRIGNQFDYDHQLNNLFHYGLDFSQFIIDVENESNNFFFFNDSGPNKSSNTRSFDFSKGTINQGVNILQYSNKRIIKTNIANE